MALEILDLEHFDKLRAFAERMGAAYAENLKQRLAYLENYGNGKYLCKIYPDWAQYSFAFVMHDEQGKPWFNGGLIYHGATPDEPRLDPLSVTLTNEPMWSIHT